MLNLEEPGVSLINFGCFPDRSFFFLMRHLSSRGMFRLFYAATTGVELGVVQVFQKTGRPEYYPAGDGDFLLELLP